MSLAADAVDTASSSRVGRSIVWVSIALYCYMIRVGGRRKRKIEYSGALLYMKSVQRNCVGNKKNLRYDQYSLAVIQHVT